METNNYLSKEEFDKVKDFSIGKKTPFLVLDLDKVKFKYDELIENMPMADVFYAVKANPHPEVLKVLRDKGSCFDIASVYELDLLLSLDISADRMSFGNTIKKASDIKYAYDKGIRLFVTDSESDLNKLAEHAPGSQVFFRLLCETSGADWPLSRKFGSHPDMIYQLILKTKELDLIPYGLSFHVGSQQRDIGQWDNAIAQCNYLFAAAKEQGIDLEMINIGGGFPARYVSPTQDIALYSKAILNYLEQDFGENMPRIILEPGRSIVADAGVIVSEVVLKSKKSELNQYEWVYIDAGKFGGLIETLDECIRFPILTDRDEENQKTEVILAGPTCDSMDILYEKNKYRLPKTLQEGDKVYILTTGAYTSTYSSVCFNGFPPLSTYILSK